MLINKVNISWSLTQVPVALLLARESQAGMNYSSMSAVSPQAGGRDGQPMPNKHCDNRDPRGSTASGPLPRRATDTLCPCTISWNNKAGNLDKGHVIPIPRTVNYQVCVSSLIDCIWRSGVIDLSKSRVSHHYRQVMMEKGLTRPASRRLQMSAGLFRQNTKYSTGLGMK